MLADTAELLAVTLPAEPAPASECNAAMVMRERAEPVLGAADGGSNHGRALRPAVRELERGTTKERSVSICQRRWLAIEGECDKH